MDLYDGSSSTSNVKWCNYAPQMYKLSMYDLIHRIATKSVRQRGTAKKPTDN